MATAVIPIPIKDAIARPRGQKYRTGEKDPNEGLITDPWIKYFSSIGLEVSTSAQRLVSTTLTEQAASISPTSLNIGTTASGLFLVLCRARITRAATTNSSLTVTIGWTESGLTPTDTPFPAITGNTTTSNDGGLVFCLIDSASPITYSTTYASTGATSMQYTLTITVMQIQA